MSHSHDGRPGGRGVAVDVRLPAFCKPLLHAQTALQQQMLASLWALQQACIMHMLRCWVIMPASSRVQPSALLLALLLAPKLLDKSKPWPCLLPQAHLKDALYCLGALLQPLRRPGCREPFAAVHLCHSWQQHRVLCCVEPLRKSGAWVLVAMRLRHSTSSMT